MRSAAVLPRRTRCHCGRRHLIRAAIAKHVKPFVEQVVSLAKPYVRGYALQRDWEFSRVDALALGGTIGSQLLRIFIRTHFDKSATDDPSIEALVEATQALAQDCSRDFHEDLKAMRSVCKWQTVTAVDLVPTLDHIGTKLDDPLWISFLISWQGASLMSLALGKVNDSKRSEEDSSKIANLEKVFSTMKMPEEESGFAIDAFVNDCCFPNLDAFMEVVASCSQATVESRSATRLVPLAAKLEVVMFEFV